MFQPPLTAASTARSNRDQASLSCLVSPDNPFAMTESSTIRHCAARLAKVRDALSRLESAKTLDDAESAWSDLLIAGNGIYSKLEQGSKLSGKASAWFGRAKKARKDDSLLSYMHHARNSEEHGIEDITQRVKAGTASVTLREPYDPQKLEGLQLHIGTDKRGHVRVSSSNEDVISTKMYDTPSLILVRVKDPRFKEHFDPPYEHLSAPIADQSPLAIGKLFIAHLERLVDEAMSFGI
jgi:hypothetical protein